MSFSFCRNAAIRFGLAIVLFGTPAFLNSESLQGQIYYVDSLGDDPNMQASETDGRVTLREAITAASTDQPFGDAHAGQYFLDEIRFRLPGRRSGRKVIRLKGEIEIGGRALTIRASGVSLAGNVVEINGDNRFRIFRIAAGSAVNMYNLDFSDGRSDSEAGAMFLGRDAHVFARSCEFKNCLGVYGGAIHSKGGSGHLSSCAFIDNWASQRGGAVYLAKGSRITSSSSTYTRNHANRAGGGVFIERANSVDDFTRFYGANVTMVDNSVGFPGLYSGSGGAIAASQPGGVYQTLDLVNAIIADNISYAQNGQIANDDVDAEVDLADNNLIGFADAYTGLIDGQQNNRVGTQSQPLNPRLGSLGFHGGYTRNYVPLYNSPAKDTGDNQYVDGSLPIGPTSLLDQRGHTRIQNGTVDLGSVER